MKRTHLTVNGGEGYLPFAKQKLKELEGSLNYGVSFGNRRFDMGDATVTIETNEQFNKIRIDGDDEYIICRSRNQKSPSYGLLSDKYSALTNPVFSPYRSRKSLIKTGNADFDQFSLIARATVNSYCVKTLSDRSMLSVFCAFHREVLSAGDGHIPKYLAAKGISVASLLPDVDFVNESGQEYAITFRAGTSSFRITLSAEKLASFCALDFFSCPLPEVKSDPKARSFVSAWASEFKEISYSLNSNENQTEFCGEIFENDSVIAAWEYGQSKPQFVFFDEDGNPTAVEYPSPGFIDEFDYTVDGSEYRVSILGINSASDGFINSVGAVSISNEEKSTEIANPFRRVSISEYSDVPSRAPIKAFCFSRVEPVHYLFGSPFLFWVGHLALPRARQWSHPVSWAFNVHVCTKSDSKTVIILPFWLCAMPVLYVEAEGDSQLNYIEIFHKSLATESPLLHPDFSGLLNESGLSNGIVWPFHLFKPEFKMKAKAEINAVMEKFRGIPPDTPPLSRPALVTEILRPYCTIFEENATSLYEALVLGGGDFLLAPKREIDEIYKEVKANAEKLL